MFAAGAQFVGSEQMTKWRSLFSLPAGAQVERARAYVAAPGCAIVSFNGKATGDPSDICPWTQLDQHLVYVTHDITALLQAGDNVVGVLAGSVMFKGTPAVMMKVTVSLSNGDKQSFVTHAPPAPPPVDAAQCVANVEENTAVSLGCEHDVISKVSFVSFGTPGGVCTGGKNSSGNTFRKNSSCDASSAQGIVESLCIGRKACTVTASKNVFGDPCRLTRKHFDAAVSCGSAPVPPAEATALHFVATASHIISNDPFAGTATNWSMLQPGWDTVAFQPVGWATLNQSDFMSQSYVALMAPPSTVVRTIAPVSITQLTPRRWVYDFGENVVGQTVLQSLQPGVPSQCVTLSHGELLAANGTVYLMHTDQIDRHYLGDTKEMRGRFTWHGFQYVQVDVDFDGFSARPEALTTLVMNTNVTSTGQITFHGSTPDIKLLQQLQDIVRRSQIGNVAQYMPTDCPTREVGNRRFPGAHGFLGMHL